MLRAISPERRCYIIGNGGSRLRYQLDQIPYTTFGCNQLYRDFQPTYLLAQDPGVLRQMARDGYQGDVWVPPQKYRNHQGAYQRMRAIAGNITETWLTGEWCIIMAAQLGFNRMDLIGFDGGPDSHYRPRTDTNQSLERCQTHRTRYQHSFQRLQQRYPHITIKTDQYFMQAYK